MAIAEVFIPKEADAVLSHAEKEMFSEIVSKMQGIGITCRLLFVGLTWMTGTKKEQKIAYREAVKRFSAENYKSGS